MSKGYKVGDQDAYLLQTFTCDSLSEELQTICRPFRDLANTLYKYLPPDANRTAALQKLIEAKDSAMRALFQG